MYLLYLVYLLRRIKEKAGDAITLTEATREKVLERKKTLAVSVEEVEEPPPPDEAQPTNSSFCCR